MGEKRGSGWEVVWLGGRASLWMEEVVTETKGVWLNARASLLLEVWVMSLVFGLGYGLGPACGLPGWPETPAQVQGAVTEVRVRVH